MNIDCTYYTYEGENTIKAKSSDEGIDVYMNHPNRKCVNIRTHFNSKEEALDFYNLIVKIIDTLP